MLRPATVPMLRKLQTKSGVESSCTRNIRRPQHYKIECDIAHAVVLPSNAQVNPAWATGVGDTIGGPAHVGLNRLLGTLSASMLRMELRQRCHWHIMTEIRQLSSLCSLRRRRPTRVLDSGSPTCPIPSLSCRRFRKLFSLRRFLPLSSFR